MPTPKPSELKEAHFTVDADSFKNYILVHPLTIPDDLPFDPYLDARRIIAHDWNQYSPTGRVCGICIDTGTEMSYNILRYVATTGRGGAAGAPTYGVEDDPWDRDAYRGHRMQDYQDAQGMTVSLLKALNRRTGIKHKFVLGHEQEISHKEMVKAGRQYVPEEIIDGYDMEIAGKRWQKKLTVFFEEYLWLQNAGYNSMDIRLHLLSDGKRVTKFRSMSPKIPSEIRVPFSYEGMTKVWRDLAKLRSIDLSSPDGPGCCMALYGPGGSGKTSLVTSLPPEVFEIGPLVYVAYDPASAQMSSTWPELLVPKATHQ